MSLADDILNGTYKQKGISVNISKKETQTAPVKNVSEEIIRGTYTKRNINTDLTSKSKSRLNTIKKKQEQNLQKLASVKSTNEIGQINMTNPKVPSNVIQAPQLPTNTTSNTRGREVGRSDISTLPVGGMKLVKQEDTKDAQEMTLLQQQARKRAEEKNENISKGGVEAFNEVADSWLNAIPSGAMSASAGLGDVATTVGATAVKTANKLIKSEKLDDVYDDIVNSGRYINEKGNFLNNVNSQVENGVVRDVTNVIHTVSQMATNAGIGAATGIPGSAVQGISVGGSSAQEVLNEDKDKIYRAGITGATKGAVAYGIEKLSDFNILTKGTKTSSIQNLVNKKIAEKFSTNLGRKVASKITGIAGENVEEFLEDNIDNVIDKLVNNKEMPGFKEWLSNTTETLKATTLSTIIADLLGLGGGSYQDITNEVQKNTEAQKWINEAQKIIKKENLGIDNVINSQPTAPIQQTQNQPTAPVNTLNQQQNQSQPIAPINNIFNQNQTQNEQILPTQQITQQENQMAQNGNMEQTLPAQNDYRNQATNEIETTEKDPTRHEIIQKNREVARENIKNISNWKDKKRGLSYQLETMERNMYDIIPDKAEAKKINETYFEPIHAQEAQKQKFINSYNDRIKRFNLNKYESEAVQLLGEQKYNPDFKADEVKEVLDRVNKNIENGKVDKQKVDNAIEEFRNIYDELFERENKALRDNGYKEKPYRKGYFPHFIDYVPETKTEKLLNKLGFKIDKRPLPTDIAGITEQFVPGKTWNKSFLERKTNKTDYNALKGFDTYIAQASDNIFHTENIQRLRGLENEIRYQYSDKGVQERIDNILNDETLYAEEKQDMINNIFEQVDNPMPNLVTELRRYTNALANKKSEADRSIENMIGRDVYSTVNAIENKFGANAVGLNFGSAFTNIIPITQAWSQVSTKNMSRAAIDTVKSYLTNDGFVDSSNFLTSRLNQSEKLYKTGIEKISDKSSFLFNAIDDVTSNIVVRGKYLENIEKGMSQTEAIKDADQFARNVMADRSKGALPTKFEEKNPITKAFTQFQLEVNNQYRYMFKDIPRDLAEKGLGSIALAFFKMFVGAWLYNEASEKITGRRPAFDPIDIVKTSYESFADKDKSTYDKITGTAKNIGEELPFVGGLMGGGRIPLNGAIPSVSNVTKATTGLITGEMDSKKALNTLGKEFAKPGYYLLPPFGGAQLKKSIEGISTVKKGGSYGVDKEGKETLQFPVENPKATDYIKAGIFGKYAVPLAKDYTDSNYKSLNAKQTKAYKESNIPYKEYMTYLNQNLKKNEEKVNYINNQKWSDSQKWGIYTNEILSDKERDDGGSQLKDAQYAIKNGTSKAEYMKLYNETSKRNMSMPTTKEMQKFQKQNLELKDYVNYQIKVHDKTALYRKSGQLDENEQLKNKDKLQILLDSDYSNKQKTSLYESCIKNKDKEDTISTYETMKKAGLNINEWLKYEQQEFESDKKDDGTLTGKSVSGSKKQKVYSYINSANMNYEQRLLLLGTQYKLNNSERKTLVNYVNNMKADYSTRMKIFSKIKGITVYKNGTIKY